MYRFIVSVVGTTMLGLLAGCSGVSEVTKQQVARSETTVQQAKETVGNSEAGAVELQRATELMEAARKEVRSDNDVAAGRYASQAQLTAELAAAKSQSAQARKAADELVASIETLRQEAARGPTGATTTP
jgi:hypothetical protein